MICGDLCLPGSQQSLYKALPLPVPLLLTRLKDRTERKRGGEMGGERRERGRRERRESEGRNRQRDTETGEGERRGDRETQGVRETF